ncbi:hypothetical protein PQR62_13245 [Herbaspirillum lusitanum]|jgi:hypothetical protein|uniref:Uncharacterized protein n=1 Tax=Herbaspirillum lusitanum TaxID=213312 RepID=A0ABW9A8P2_9BURK
MLEYLLFMAAAAAIVYLLDRMWLQHFAWRRPALQDPSGYLELTRRLTEMCHGVRDEADRLIALQKAAHPEMTHAQAVAAALQEMLAPDRSGLR